MTKENKRILIVFVVIFIIGIFFRTYNFHSWLLFENDQARDATVTGQVVAGEVAWPLLGPTMRASGSTENTLFRIGPVYYYFQIVSATIFGARADTMAYPDLFFNTLLLPLLYFFFRRYFGIRTALFLTGLSAVSFFSIRYSRFAWNPNLIPFFVILFLISAHEFLVKKEKVSWWWVGIFGLALGVGVQLHATMLLLLCLVWGVVAAYLLLKNRSLWKKLLTVFLLALFINSPQIVSEWQTGFANSRALFNFSAKESSSESSEKKSSFSIVADTVSCQIETNAYLLSSLGQEECNYSYVKIWEKSRSGNKFRETVSWSWLFIVFIFSFFGYFLLGNQFCKEQDESKRYLLGLIGLFSLFFLVVMLPVIGSGFKEFRYFNPGFFVPLILFGLIIDFFFQKQNKAYIFIAVLMIVFVIAGNVHSLYTMATRLSLQKGNDGHAVYLGEVENIVRYMKDLAGFSEKIYVMSEKVYSGNIFTPGSYVAKQSGYSLLKVLNLEDVPKGAPLFFIAENSGENAATIHDILVKNMRNFGIIRVYQLEH